MVFYSYAETKQAQVDGQYYSTPTFSPPYWAPPQGPALTQALASPHPHGVVRRALFNQNKE